MQTFLRRPEYCLAPSRAGTRQGGRRQLPWQRDVKAWVCLSRGWIAIDSVVGGGGGGGWLVMMICAHMSQYVSVV